MHFIIHCKDKAENGYLRGENRSAHLDYLKSYADRIVAAGPMLSDDGQYMVGSLLIMEFADLDGAQAFCAGDPYTRAGLFESVAITPWKKVYPADPA